MIKFKRISKNDNMGLISSTLYDELTFYPAFFADMQRATSTIIVESPFISQRRLQSFYPLFIKAIQRGVHITINTRDPQYHDEFMEQQAVDGIAVMQQLGVEMLYTGNHHRKIAIVDQAILYEGSLNILSQSDSCEIMRRIASPELVQDMIRFTGLGSWYTE